MTIPPEKKLSDYLVERAAAPAVPPGEGSRQTEESTAYWSEVRNRGRAEPWKNGESIRPATVNDGEPLIPGFESLDPVPAAPPPEPETRKRIVDDPEHNLPGLTDDPCPWAWVAKDTYYNTGTGEIFEWSGEGSGILTTRS
jgi:hypothetical protein